MLWGTGSFKVRIGGDVLEYSHWDEIPETFDNLIKFVPDIPPGPHTQEQHDEIDTIPDIFREFLKRERNASRD